MASIRSRPESGMLFLDFRYRGSRCREQTALPDTTSNRKRLSKLLERIEADIAAGTFDYQRSFPGSKNAHKFTSDEKACDASPCNPTAASGQNNATVPSGTPTFRAFSEIWWQERLVEWRRSHQQRVRLAIDQRLNPHFGDMEVGQISKADILAYRAALAKVQARGKTTTLSNAHINKIMNPLRQILSEAADRFNFRTPFEHIKQLRVKKSDVQPFSLDEVKLLLDTVRPDFRPYLTVRFFTGMRTGEVHGLQWKYVDFERRLILVRETVVQGEDEYTKTDYSQRDIQMSQAVFDALRAQKAMAGDHSKYVFATRAGTPLDFKNVNNRVWLPLLRHLGLAPRRPYQCRHTAATLWLAAGESPEWIARQLGHANTEMLFRVYSRYVPNLTRNDGSAFERLLLHSALSTPGGTQKTDAASSNESEVRNG